MPSTWCLKQLQPQSVIQYVNPTPDHDKAPYIDGNAMIAGDVTIHHQTHAAVPFHKCKLCGKIAAEGMHECPGCGATVCAEDFSKKGRLCLSCAELEAERRAGLISTHTGITETGKKLAEIRQALGLRKRQPGDLETDPRPPKRQAPVAVREQMDLAAALLDKGKAREALSCLQGLDSFDVPLDAYGLLYAQAAASSSGPKAALAWVRRSGWAGPTRQLAEFLLEESADQRSRVLYDAMLLHPDSPETALMRGMQFLQTSLSQPALLEKAKEFLKCASESEALRHEVEQSECVIAWLDDTSRARPVLRRHDLVARVLTKLVGDVGKMGIKSLRPAAHQFIPDELLDEERAKGAAKFPVASSGSRATPETRTSAQTARDESVARRRAIEELAKAPPAVRFSPHRATNPQGTDAPDEKVYFLHTGQATTGPFVLAQLIDHAKKSTAESGHYWREGWKEWRALSDLFC